jgi:hypothetical protein
MHLRAAYKFALLLSVPTYMLSWSISLAALSYPSLFAPEDANALRPLNAFIPPNPFAAYNTKIANIAQGSHHFLQWDVWISSAAYLIFAVAAKHKALGKAVSLADITRILVKAALFGPMSVALMILWQRDELVLSKGEEKGEKKG